MADFYFRCGIHKKRIIEWEIERDMDVKSYSMFVEKIKRNGHIKFDTFSKRKCKRKCVGVFVWVCVWKEQEMNELWMNVWFTGKATKLLLSAFVISYHLKFNVMWRHWILYQSKESCNEHAHQPNHRTPTQSLCARSAQYSCNVEYVVWNFLSFATVCITPYHCCGIENTTQILFVVSTHTQACEWLKGKFVVCTKRFSSLLFECVFPSHTHTHTSHEWCVCISWLWFAYTCKWYSVCWFFFPLSLLGLSV